MKSSPFGKLYLLCMRITLRGRVCLHLSPTEVLTFKVLQFYGLNEIKSNMLIKRNIYNINYTRPYNQCT